MLVVLVISGNAMDNLGKAITKAGLGNIFSSPASGAQCFMIEASFSFSAPTHFGIRNNILRNSWNRATYPLS